MSHVPAPDPSAATPRDPASRASAPRARKRPLVELVAEVPQLVTALVRAEIDLIKTELIGKLKSLGIGAGLLVGALAVLLFMVGTLLTAAILGLAEVMPPWLAALIVSAFLLIVAVVLALIGWRTLRRGLPPVPTEAIDSLKKDVQSIKGLRKRGQYR
ncbi:MAG: phage holin family protein [Micrococcales bacterium]|nr:phage holin family protein [Micrococcales bacterium]